LISRGIKYREYHNMATYGLERVSNKRIPEIIPENTLNRDIIEGLPVFSIEYSKYYTKYLTKKGEKWYTRGTIYGQDADPITGKTYKTIITEDIDFGYNNELLKILLTKERAISLKFIIFDEFYKTVGLPELSNMIKMLYYVLNI
jgi:hypothetical protein